MSKLLVRNSLKKNEFLILLLHKISFNWIKTISKKRTNIHIWVYNHKNILNLLNFLKKNSFFKIQQVVDIYGVDFLNFKSDGRFELNYVLLSLYYNTRIIVRSVINLYDIVNTTTSLFKSSGWLEREIWDMLGIFFCKHNDLRRILTDYGFSGHPLRKDFPLPGYWEVSYDDRAKSVVFDLIELSQDFRIFKLKDKVW